MSSGTPCPYTGTLHLPRLYGKLTLDEHGKLADGYPAFGAGYDQMVATALGLTKEQVTLAAKGRSYTEFVMKLKHLGANFGTENIAKLNASITGYEHDDATRQGILSAEGLTNADVDIKGAVELNILDDLRGFFASLQPQVKAPLGAGFP